MAPLRAPQSRMISPPRPLKGQSATPVSSERFISGKVFALLFVGTFCIFFVGVFFWKIGAVIRFFTQDRVLGKQKTTTARYARTWYGWVPLSRHRTNKRAIKKGMRKIRRWMSWRSSHADYRWVWWDPGEKETQKHYDDRKAIRWLPKWLLSYEFPTADSIWNPGPLPEKQKALCDTENYPPCTDMPQKESSTNTHMTGAKQTFPSASNGEDDPLKMVQSFTYQQQLIKINPYHICNQPFIVAPVIYVPPEPISQYQYLALQRRRNRIPSRRQSEDVLGTLRDHTEWKDFRRPLRRTASLPSMMKLTSSFGTVCSSSVSKSQKAPVRETDLCNSRRSDVRLSRKYQAWAARMQIQIDNNSARRFHGLSGRPGSPLSELLHSISSEQSTYTARLGGNSNKSESTQEYFLAGNPEEHEPLQEDRESPQTNSKFAEPSQTKHESDSRSHAPTASVLLASDVARYRPLQVRDPNCPLHHERLEDRTRERRRVTFQGTTDIRTHTATRKSPPLRNLSNPEVRLMHDLDRRLEWLLNELDPGRKPFHFATLANHWLNTETWIVYDPPCRVSREYRRRFGDPRLNTPSSDGNDQPRRPKYPVSNRKRAHTPRIDSWRIAVNKQRKTAGLQEFLREIELFNGSADEVPDGKIDPASWILRKPPQGFPMSNKQKSGFWEGACGWQEPLQEWQKVRYSYRVEKTIHEVKINRTRDLKQVARGVTKIYRHTAGKLPHVSTVPGARRNFNSDGERRQSRSGHGSIGGIRTTLNGEQGDTRAYNIQTEAIQACRAPDHISSPRQSLTGNSPTDLRANAAAVHAMENG